MIGDETEKKRAVTGFSRKEEAVPCVKSSRILKFTGQRGTSPHVLFLPVQNERVKKEQPFKRTGLGGTESAQASALYAAAIPYYIGKRGKITCEIVSTGRPAVSVRH